MIYNRVCAKIDLDAIMHNINTVKSKIKSGTKIMAVVKADAYGHGAVSVATHLQDTVDYFGVADVFEGLELRRNGIKNGILILSFTAPEFFETVVENDITATIFDLDSANQLSAVAKEFHKTAKIHIAVDTGMSRIGYAVNEQSIEQIKQIEQLDGIYIEGIFSHYATADEADKTEAKKQKERFEWFIKSLESQGINIPIKHLSNSAGIMEMDTDFNMVRAGIITYGLYPSDEVKTDSFTLKPAMEIIAHISFVKTVKKGQGISYGLTFKPENDIKVATLPIGYADGYPRALSNKSYVLIKGQKCRVLGRVCMDQLMVDVTGLDVKVLDEVTVLGNSGNENISVELLANMAGSFNYEFVCGISRRVPRIYYKDNKPISEINYLE
ncbi:MAG: alanine racemase [Clostridia bacterium]|nr:alanine racemase [Clostridia bacterium]